MTSVDPLDPLDLNALLSEEERGIRDAAREWVVGRVLPEIEDWYETGEVPAREIAKELGALGFLGMHLHGYGCIGANAVSYGLAALELEAGDSGLRSLVSVQGSLAMFAILTYGSDEQKDEWLPRMAAGEAIGCFGLSEPDAGSDPGRMRTSARRDGDDWIVSGTKMWITNGSVADVSVVWAHTDDGIRGFLDPRRRDGVQRQRRPPQDVAAGLGHLRAGAGRRAPARLGDASRSGGAQGSAVVPERGALRDRVGRDGCGAGVLRHGARLRRHARSSSTARSRASS